MWERQHHLPKLQLLTNPLPSQTWGRKRNDIIKSTCAKTSCPVSARITKYAKLSSQFWKPVCLDGSASLKQKDKKIHSKFADEVYGGFLWHFERKSKIRKMKMKNSKVKTQSTFQTPETIKI